MYMCICALPHSIGADLDDGTASGTCNAVHMHATVLARMYGGLALILALRLH